MNDTLTAEERLNLLQARRGALAAYEQTMDRMETPLDATQFGEQLEAKRRLAEAEGLEGEYFARLPMVAMGCCPFDGRTLLRSFDPWGLDGPWWRGDATPIEPEACPHFYALTGSLALGSVAHSSPWDVDVGPEVPFVLPRLLAPAEAVAVVSRVATEFGAVAHVIAYFAPRRPKPEERAAAWCRGQFVHSSLFGVHRWRYAREVLDYDLPRWLRAGKLRWCDPDCNPTELSPIDAECPFVGLGGSQRPATITVRGVLRRPVCSLADRLATEV